MTLPTPKRYVINDVDALIRIMHRDHRYALDFRNKAEQHITLKLRKKFFRTSPEVVLDAFNNALMKFLQVKTFRAESFLEGQPADGWTAHELAVSKLGGYLYRGSANEVIMAYRRSKHEVELVDLDDAAQDARAKHDDFNELSDPSLFSDPALAYEHMELIKRMRDCMSKLSDTLRGTMFLYLDDLSMEQIAQRQELQVPTVKSRLHAARKLVIECARKGID